MRLIKLQFAIDEKALKEDPRGLREALKEAFINAALNNYEDIYVNLGYGHGDGTMPENVREATPKDIVPGALIWHKGKDTCHFHVVDQVFMRNGELARYTASDEVDYNSTDKYVLVDDGFKVGMVVTEKPVTEYPRSFKDLWVVQSGEYGNYFVSLDLHKHGTLFTDKLDTGIAEKCYPLRFLMLEDLKPGYYPAIHQPTGKVGVIVYYGKDNITFEEHGKDDAMAISDEHDEFVLHSLGRKYADARNLYEPFKTSPADYEDKDA